MSIRVAEEKRYNSKIVNFIKNELTINLLKL